MSRGDDIKCYDFSLKKSNLLLQRYGLVGDVAISNGSAVHCRDPERWCAREGGDLEILYQLPLD